MKRGVNAWIYPPDFTVDRILEVSSEIGYDGVELNLVDETLKLTRKQRKGIVEKAESLGLELPSLCSALFWKLNLASPDRDIRNRGIDLLKKGCEFASDLEASVLLVVPAVAVPEITYQETWQLSKRGILEAAPTAEDCGVLLGIENVWNRFLCSPLEFRRFIEEIDHPNVKAYFDVGNVYLFGYPQQWVRHLSDLIVCVHVKDLKISAAESKPLLQGDVPWPEVVKALKEIGYNGFLNVEVSPYPGHPTKSAVDNKASLDIILNMA